VFLARQFILSIPRDLIEAARMDGASHVRVFTRIVVPLSKPLIAVLFFMSLLQSWNDLAWPLIALKENELFTRPIGLLYLRGQFGSDFGTTVAFALINVVPMVVLFLVFQRYFVQGFVRSGVQ
jgi:multiple sugar transport system permease protein/alpha-1,4-digalacturonate transport system permease protein